MGSHLNVRNIAIQILHKIKRAISPKRVTAKKPNLRVRTRRRFALIARSGSILTEGFEDANQPYA